MLVMFVHERMPEPGRPTTGWGYIGNLFVHPDHRDDGAGAALLSAAVGDAKRRKLARLVLNPSPRSVSLYHRAGFKGSHGLLTLDLG
jgi:GNAT superfamily N-acetyltransferase